MKVTIKLPIDGVDGKIVAMSPQGKPVEVESIEIEPFFYSPSQRVPVLYGTVILGGGVDKRETHNFTMQLAGSTGKCSLLNKLNVVRPKIEEVETEKNKTAEEQDSRESSQQQKPPSIAGFDHSPLPGNQ